MRSSLILTVLLPLCISLVAAIDGTTSMNITGLSTCAKSCLATFTSCSLDDTACICYGARSIPEIPECLLQDCTLDEGRTLQRVLESSCENNVVQSQQRLVLDVTLSFSALAILFILVKILIQVYEYGRLFPEDLCLFLAGAGQAALATLVSLATFSGFGRHMLDVNSGHLRQGLTYIFSAIPVYWLVLLLTRLSAVFFIGRISSGRIYRICTAAMIAFILVWGTLIIVLSILQCRPISYNWNVYLDRHIVAEEASCWNLETLAYSANAISLLQEVLILALAISLLWTLPMKAAKRFGAGMILIVGLFVCAAAGLRLRSLVTFTNNTVDPTWDNVPAILWSVIETATGILVICLPVLGEFFSKTNCFNFPEDVSDGGSKADFRYRLAYRSGGYPERGWDVQSPESFGDTSIERKVQVGRSNRVTDAELESMRSRDSNQRLATTIQEDRPESIMTHNTASREHLNRTYREHDKISLHSSPSKGRTKRLASPTQGIFQDTIWRDAPPNSSLTIIPAQPSPIVARPLPSPSPTNQEQGFQEYRLHPKPLRVYRNSLASSTTSRNSVVSETLSRISEIHPIPENKSTSENEETEPRKSEPHSMAMIMGFPFPFRDSIHSSTTNSLISVSKSPSLTPTPSFNSILSETNQNRHSHLSEPEEMRALPKIPGPTRTRSQNSARSQSTLRPRSQPPKALQLNANARPSTSGSVQKQIILEHQDENGEEMGKADVDKRDRPVTGDWSRKSRIRRTRSGRAVVFNGQVLHGDPAV